MKQRIISALIGVALLILLLAVRGTFIFNIAIALIAAVAVFEIFRCARIKKIGLYALSIGFTAVIQLVSTIPDFVPVIAFAILYCLLVLGYMLRNHKSLRYEQTCIAMATTFFITFSFNSLLQLNCIDKIYPDTYIKWDGLFYLLMVLICAWATDTGAYFTGILLGKHKLAPNISPKKTIEGAVGGVLTCVLVNLLSMFIFNRFVFAAQHISIVFVIISSIVLSLVGMLGDLCASLIKRNYNVKDFGNIMPGHGGVMDRFDSISFVAPALYVLIIFIINF